MPRSTGSSAPPELPIDAARVRLRWLVPGDAGAIYRMSQEDGMRARLPSQVYRDEAHAASVVAFLIARYRDPADPRLGPYVLGVELAVSAELIGHVGLSPLDGGVEVGFAIAQAHQRQGLATAAVRAACEWAANAFALPKILGIAAADNMASHGVLLQAGFVRKADRAMHFQGREQAVACFEFTAPEV